MLQHRSSMTTGQKTSMGNSTGTEHGLDIVGDGGGVRTGGNRE